MLSRLFDIIFLYIHIHLVTFTYVQEPFFNIYAIIYLAIVIHRDQKGQ